MKKRFLQSSLFKAFFFSFLFVFFVFLSSNKVSAYSDKYVIYNTNVVYEDGTEFKDMGYFFSEYTGAIDGLNLRLTAKNNTTSTITIGRKIIYYDLNSQTFKNVYDSTPASTIASGSYGDLGHIKIIQTGQYTFRQAVEVLNNLDFPMLLQMYKDTHTNSSIFEGVSLSFDFIINLELNDEDTTTRYGTNTYLPRLSNDIMSFENIVSFNVSIPHDNFTEDYDKYFEEGFNAGAGENSYQKGFEDGKNSVDITIDNKEAIEEYIDNNELKTQEEYLQYGEEKYINGFNAGKSSVDITSNDDLIYMEAYTQGLENGKIIGAEEALNSLDLEAIKKSEYDRGFENGRKTGFAEGEASVDITSDNDTVIHAYIKKYNYHTDFDFNLNFDLGFNEGVKYVYKNIETDEVVTKYVKEYIRVNKYHTNTQYIDNSDEYYKKGFSDGVEFGKEQGKQYIYRTIESDPIIQEHWRTKIVNGIEINFVTEGGEKVYLIKRYDINYKDTGDFKIIIHEGQDTYRVETIENVIPGAPNKTEESTQKDYSNLIDFFKKAGIVLAVFVATIVVIFVLNLVLSFVRRKGSVKVEKRFAI